MCLSEKLQLKNTISTTTIKIVNNSIYTVCGVAIYAFFGVKFLSWKWCRCQKMRNIRYGRELYRITSNTTISIINTCVTTFTSLTDS